MLPTGVINQRYRRKVRQREKKHRRRGGLRRWPFAIRQVRLEFARLMAPKIIGLHHPVYRSATLSLCDRIRTTLLRKDRSIIIDFSQTERIEAAGMLLVMAELDRAKRMVGARQVARCKLPDATTSAGMIVRQVLHQVGLLDLTGHDASNMDPDAFDATVRHWRYATGTRVDSKPGDLLEEHEGRISPGLMQGMQIGLAEALLNSLHHAYRADRGDGCPPSPERRWWMFTQELEGRLAVLVCDLGIGIPRSLPLVWGKALIGKFLKSLGADRSDINSIRLALVVGESSTGDSHRGNGLPQVWNATTASGDGRIEIFSGKAVVGYECAGQRDTESQYKGSIMGTLISWSVPVEAGTDGQWSSQ